MLITGGGLVVIALVAGAAVLGPGVLGALQEDLEEEELASGRVARVPETHISNSDTKRATPALLSTADIPFHVEWAIVQDIRTDEVRILPDSEGQLIAVWADSPLHHAHMAARIELRVGETARFFGFRRTFGNEVVVTAVEKDDDLSLHVTLGGESESFNLRDEAQDSADGAMN